MLIYAYVSWRGKKRLSTTWAAERIVISKIKSLRLEAKLSLNQFARLADLDRATVSKAEKGAAVSELTLHKIAAALGRQLDRSVDADELVS